MPKNSLSKLNIQSLLASALNGNAIEQCDAIREIVNRQLKSSASVDNSVIGSLSSLQSSMTVFWNTYTVGDFATAAICLLRNEPYDGNRDEVSQLIEVKMDFS